MKKKTKFETLSMVNYDGRYRHDEPYLILSVDFLFNSYLGMLSGIFDEGSSWTKAVKRHLADPDSRGITGDMIDITIKDNKVIIAAEHVDDPEENAIEIDKQDLLDIINKWEELKAQNCQRITFTRHEDGTIAVAGS